MKRANIRVLVVGLVVLTAGLTFTALAQSKPLRPAPYVRGNGPLYDDTARVCRNGVKVRVADDQSRGPFTLEVFNLNGDVIASKTVRLKRRTVTDPVLGKLKFSGTYKLFFDQALLPQVGDTVRVGAAFDATVQNCRLREDDEDD